MKKKSFYLCIIVNILFIHTFPAIAQDYCNNVSGSGLDLGCAKTLSNTGLLGQAVSGSATPTNLYMKDLIGRSYDGLIWDADWIAGHGEGRLRFEQDVKFSIPRFDSWKNIYIGSTRNDGQKTAIDMVSRPQLSTIIEDSKVTIQFDRLTLENTALSLKDAASADGLQTGTIEYLVLGSAGAGQGGRLTMRNSSLKMGPDINLLINAPSGAAYIRAESGDNLLKLNRQLIYANQFSVHVDDSAKLTITDTKLLSQQEGSLHVGMGSRLNIENDSILQLLQSNGSALAQSTVTGGEINIDGHQSELRVTAPVFSDSNISLKNGGSLRVQERGNERSSLSFVGNNTLSFEHGDSAVLGASVHPNHLLLNIGTGITSLTGVIPSSANHGLQVDKVNIDGGTLDITNYGANATEWESLTVVNGGVLFDRFKMYDKLQTLEVNAGTLKSLSRFGSFQYNGMTTAKLTNSTIDLVSALGEDNLQMPAGLQTAHISAVDLEFSGSNKVLIGIHPSGKDAILNGNPIPGTTRYAGELIVNVGNDVNAKLTGFDTVLFVPKAIDPSATAKDYVSGGINKIYTVAEANTSNDVVSNKISFDAAPVTPTAMQLVTAGSDLPSDLIFTVINDPVADERVDITFIDLTTQNNHKLSTQYTPQFTKVVIQPGSNNTHEIVVSILPNLSAGASKSWNVTAPNTNNTVSIVQNAIIGPNGTVSHKITTTVTGANGSVLSTDTVTVPSGLTSGGAVQLVTTVVTDPNGAYLRTTSVGVPLEKATGTRNTASFGKLLNNSGKSLPSAFMKNGVEALNPENYASFMTVALEQSIHLRNLMLANARESVAGHGKSYGDWAEGFTESGHRVWMDASKMNGDINSNGDLAGFDYSIGGTVFGTDLWSNEAFSVGAFLGYNTYDMNEKSSSISPFDFSANVISVGGYGSYDIPNWSIIGMASYSWANTDAKRVINADTFKGDYNSQSFETSFRAEYTNFRTNDSWRIMPEIGFGYIYYNQESFTETGPSSLILHVEDTTVESLTGSVALNLTGPIFGYGIEPFGFIRYEHDFLAAQKKEHKLYASFASTPNISEPFIGTHRGPDATVTGIGLRGAVSNSVDISVGTIYKKQTYGKEYGVGLTVTHVF